MGAAVAIISVVFLGLVPRLVLAQDIPGTVLRFGCDFYGLGLNCRDPGIAFGSFANGMLPGIFWAFLFFMLVVYGITLVIRSNKEDAVQEAMTAYGHALFAAFLAATAGLLTEAFILTGDALPDTEPVANMLELFVGFLTSLALAALAANIAVQAIRMLLSQSDSGIEAARTNMIRSVLGAFLLKIADLTVLSLSPERPTDLIEILEGLGNFAVTIFGAMAVIGIVTAGIMLVISVDEGLKERAKKLIITSLAALIIVILAKAIASFFPF